MYYNMNDIDVRSSNKFLRKVFLYMVLGVAISFGTGIYLYKYNQELLFSLARYFNILGIVGVGMVLGLNFFLEKISAGMARIMFVLYSLIIGTIFIIMGFINMYLGVGPLYWIETIAGIVIFTGLTAYDINRIKWESYQLADGDNETVEKMGIREALELYLDFINLFLYLLRIFGRRK